MNTDIKFDDTKYNSSEIDRTTSASSHNPSTIIKYITPRVISSNLSNNFQGSLNNINSNFPSSATTHGLATLINTPKFSTMPSLHSIDGERIIDEVRELTHVTETLGNVILQCCNLETHNRAQELQIEWLENHNSANSSIIEKKFQTEMETAQKIINESLHSKSNLETKFNESNRTIIAYDEQYQQLLARRHFINKELFDFERQIAQNNAESQFLKRRIYNFDNEIKFYILKNRVLYERKVRLQYDLDEEIFSQQSIRMEFEVLESEKISTEDIHLISFDDMKRSIDLFQISTRELPKHYSQELNQEIQRIRDEYKKKIEVYREELHRQFELELHRYHIQKSSSLPIVTKEHELKLEQYQHENNDVQQDIAAVRGCINQILVQIESIEKKMNIEKNNEQIILNSKQRLDILNQLIKDRERQLNEVIHLRNSHKQEIENYKKRLERYSKQKSKDYYNKRLSIHEINHSTPRKSISRLSLQDLSNNNEQIHSKSKVNQSTLPSLLPKRSSIIQIEELWEEGTLTRHADFNVDQDCNDLHRLLTTSNVDEIEVIRILCNRSISQRLQIRDKYKILFNRNLGDALDTITNKNLNKLLKILLLSPIERDCYELRRILKNPNLNVNVLVEIFFTRSNKHIQAIKENYPRLFKNLLEQDIIGNENTLYKEIFLSLLQINRSEDNMIDDNEVLKDARDLYENQTKWKTDQSIFLRILRIRSNSQLKQIFTTYQQFSQIDIEQALEIHTEGNLYQTLSAIVRIIRNRQKFFATELKNIIKGATTNIDNLNRIIISRCEIDMVQIKSEYEKLVKRTLYDHIQIDTNGNYKRALLELIRQRIEPIHRELEAKNSDEQPVVFRNQLLRQSRQTIPRVSSDTFLKRSFTHCSNDCRMNRHGQVYDDNHSIHISLNSQFDLTNQRKSNRLSTINTERPRLSFNNRRSFIPMPKTDENNSNFNNE